MKAAICSVCLVCVLIAAGCLEGYAQTTKEVAEAPWIGFAECPDLMKGIGIFGGYVGNFPDAPIGFSILCTVPKGRTCLLGSLGLYADFKYQPDPYYEGEYYPNISVNQAENVFHDPFQEKGDSWTEFNVGVTKVIASKIAIYAAGGFTNHHLYRRYYDPTEILGLHGSYWVSAGSESKGSLTAGVLLQFPKKTMCCGNLIAGPQAIQLGFDSRPKGLSVGLLWGGVFEQSIHGLGYSGKQSISQMGQRIVWTRESKGVAGFGPDLKGDSE